MDNVYFIFNCFDHNVFQSFSLHYPSSIFSDTLLISKLTPGNSSFGYKWILDISGCHQDLAFCCFSTSIMVFNMIFSFSGWLYPHDSSHNRISQNVTPGVYLYKSKQSRKISTDWSVHPKPGIDVDCMFW